jgi:hypothetical protein
MGSSFPIARQLDNVVVMGANIVRRRPPVKPPQPAERRPTTELTKEQLHELIRHPGHDLFEPVHVDLEAELEVVDQPEIFPDGTPISLPSTSSPRLAHTLRRGPHLEAGPAAPPPAPTAPSKSASAAQSRPTVQLAPSALPSSLVERADAAPIGRMRMSRPVAPRTAVPALDRPVTTVTAVTERLRVSRPAPSTPEAAPPPVTAMLEEASVEVDLDMDPIEPPVVAEPIRPLAPGGRRARLVVPLAAVLLALGVGAAFLLH